MSARICETAADTYCLYITVTNYTDEPSGISDERNICSRTCSYISFSN